MSKCACRVRESSSEVVLNLRLEGKIGGKVCHREGTTWAKSREKYKCLVNSGAAYGLLFLTFIYFWDRERQSMNGGGSERDGDTESETGSRLWAVSTEPDAGLKLTYREIVTWAEVGRLTDWATQVPQGLIFKRNKIDKPLARTIRKKRQSK